MFLMVLIGIWMVLQVMLLVLSIAKYYKSHRNPKNNTINPNNGTLNQ